MIRVELIVLKEVGSIVEGCEVVHVGDTCVAAVVLQPDVKLPQAGEFNIIKAGRRKRPRNYTAPPCIQLNKIPFLVFLTAGDARR